MNGLKTHVLHIDVEAILHEMIVGYSAIVKYLRFAMFGETDAIQGNLDDTSDPDPVHQTIQTLTFQSFASVRQNSRMILRLTSAEYMHFIESLGFISKRLR